MPFPPRAGRNAAGSVGVSHGTDRPFRRLSSVGTREVNVTHVLVIGASKGIGLETVKAALKAGHRVRAFARSAADIAISDPGLERFTGNALDSGDVVAALEGIDVVVQALGVPASKLLGPVSLFSEATNRLVPAMERAGIRRIIAVTGFGTGDSRAAIGLLQRVPFRLVFGRAYDDKDAQEMRIRKSGLDWTFVRPGVLTPGAATGRYKVLADPTSWRNGLVSRADVADFIAGEIGQPAHVRQAVVLVG
ncbi:Putative NADH-flavin reductase [Methylorubrum salsuginis]|uniref:Putative NADH-flavin reductase n=1 Tax=Methylorubrum salsuginis TaxID=414703 RepID=A0A1I4FQH8_9HYPH|nr:Putative NADH-flavin reductase [Methylorubrum salsuginis]